MDERYGYVDYHTPGRPLAEGVAGRWRFLLAPEVVTFAAAWDAAVLDFCCDGDAWRDAKASQCPLNYGDLVEEQGILARHGLTYLPDDPDAETVLVDHDDILVDPDNDDERCLHEEDGEVCGAWLGDNEGHDGRCGLHTAGKNDD